jgi:nitroreductase
MPRVLSTHACDDGGVDAPTPDELRAIVEAAIAAPSSHNTQPWLFALSGNEIELRADRARQLAVTDPDGRELTISCGAALLNLRAAAAGQGLTVETQLLPDADEPDLLARVALAPGDPDHVLARLAVAIPDRHTTRDEYSDRELEAPLAQDLVAAADTEGAWLEVLDEARRSEVTALALEGDRIQFSDPAWRRELASWLRSPRAGDGVTTGGAAVGLVRVLVRAVNLGSRVAATDERRANSAPLLAVLGTEGDAPGDWLRAGQALERALLTATAHGAQASFFNQPCQLPELRPRLGELLGRPGSPQIVLGLGYPDGPIEGSARRHLDAVLTSKVAGG